MDNRKVMTISVTVLGISIAAVLLAYVAFGDNTDEDMKTLKQVNVSYLKIEKFFSKDFHLNLTIRLSFAMAQKYQIKLTKRTHT
jgi:hypothetical protein